MKKACMKCKSINNEYVWEEKYEVSDETDTEIYLKEMIQRFNNTLRPQEPAREILEMLEEPLEIDTLPKIQHMWEKTNLVTQSRGGRLYDTYKCAKCGITGKRFGLSDIVKRDSKYKADKYNYCQGN